jgi:hypothetical protein
MVCAHVTPSTWLGRSAQRNKSQRRTVTLIISSISNRGVWQASDRLVSVSRTPFDPQSNKSILAIMEDAVVALSYSGSAYVGEQPTDEWLVEKISGRPIEYFRDQRPWAISVNPQPKIALRFSNVYKALRTEIAEVGTKRILFGFPLEVILAGWRWADSRFNSASHILGSIEWRPGFGLCTDWCPTMPRPGEWVIASSPASYPPKESELQAFDSRLRVAHTFPALALSVSQLVRDVGARFPDVIGPDVMCISIEPPHEAKIYIHYFSSVENSPLSYSPWLLLKDQVYAPSERIGRQVVSNGRWKIELGSPNRIGSLTFGILSQTRPQRPNPDEKSDN